MFDNNAPSIIYSSRKYINVFGHCKFCMIQIPPHLTFLLAIKGEVYICIF